MSEYPVTSGTPELTEQEIIRRQKLQGLWDAGKNPYTITHFPVTHRSAEITANFDALEGQTVTIAGRMLSRRVMGKASFAHLLDGEGDIQFYVRREDVGEDVYADFKQWDIGDIVGVTGAVFRTKTGEISVHAAAVTLLTKSLKVLPEKFHGLVDTDLRYRQRYVDTIVNPEVRDLFVKRSKIISAVREFLDGRGFLEVDTPVLQTVEIGAAARPFRTHHNALDIDMLLRIETELYLKRLIVGGFERVYELGRVFRNEGMDATHNPEYTSLETYQAYVDYHEVMEMVEQMFEFVAIRATGSSDVSYQGQTIHLAAPWKRISMADAVKEACGIDWTEWQSDAEARAEMDRRGIHVEKDARRGDCLAALFDEYVEHTLVQPTFIVDYPVEISPLAKRRPDNPALTERFEFFITGHELGNAFSELNDPIDQRRRFEEQVEQRKAQGIFAEIDEDFVTALEYGMPPTGGLGIGIDRMVMLMTDSPTIRDVLLFPTMKPMNAPKNDKKPEAAADFECACGTCPSQEACKAAQEAEKAAPAEEKIDFSNVVVEPLFADTVDFETFSRSDFRAVKVLACEAVPKSKKLLKFTLDDGSGTERTILSGIHAFYEPEQLVGKTCIAITNLPPRAMMGIESCGMLISAVHHEGEEEKLHLLTVDPHIPAGAKLY
ncbi:MAG: lysine--tRNA ligase [Clostridia bacterium]|nr:lysine--tRNA ligase [Clostridia bacterium]